MPFDTFSAAMQDKIRCLKPPDDDVTENNKFKISDEMIALMESVLQKKTQEIRLLKKGILEAKEGKSEEADLTVRKFLTMNETNFLSAKPLFYVRSEESISQKNAFLLYGRSDSFPCSLSLVEPGHYLFHLPAMHSRRSFESFQANSRNIKYSIMLLIDSFEQESSISMLKDPVVVFKHFIADKNQIPDADNLDMKVAVDTLQNIMIANDCLLDLMLFSFGVKSDTAYTELHVMEKEIFKKWL